MLQQAWHQTYLHADSQDDPRVLLDFVDFNRVINFLFGAAKEATKGIDVFVVNRAGTQVMALVLHNGHLSPLVFLHIVFFDRIKALFA